MRSKRFSVTGADGVVIKCVCVCVGGPSYGGPLIDSARQWHLHSSANYTVDSDV